MELLLEPREFRMLDGMRLRPRKSYAGRIRGERLTRKKGVSIEFADFRNYAEGDDLRHLDWNVLARLDTPVMRTYQDEEDLGVHLLLDGSPSMEFGSPSKRATAMRLGCALAYMALAGGDAVLPRHVTAVDPPSTGLRGRSAYPRLDRWAAQTPESRISLAAALRTFAASSVRTGLVILLSDGLDPEVASGLKALGGRGHEVWFVQILSPIDLDPDLEGDLRLVDPEGGPPVELTANSFALREYRRRLDAHNAEIVDSVRRIGGRHTMATSQVTLESFVRSPLKAEGWVA